MQVDGLVSAAALTALIGSASILSAQVRPPVIDNATPYGIQRGTTVTVTVDGTNLGEAEEVLFSDAGLSAQFVGHADFGPDVPVRRPEDTGPPIADRARRSIVTIEVSASRDVPLGRQGFRLRTPLGTSTFIPLWVGDLSEAGELEPNDDRARADSLTTPVTVNGALFVEGDTDTYRFAARAGRQVVVRVMAVGLGSRADPALELLDEAGIVVAASDDFGDSRDPLIVYTPGRDGDLVVRVTDALGSGSPRHVYRLTVGEVPYLTSVYPLGRPRGSSRPVLLEGANLGTIREGRVGQPLPERPDTAPVLVPGLPRDPLNRVEVMVGEYPEVDERKLDARDRRVPLLSLPVTVNGRLHRADGTPDLEDRYRFTAAKGQQVVISVAAARVGSPLDSVLEVLDSAGRVVPRAMLRPVWETSIDLRNQNSFSTGMRLLNWSELRRGDWVYVDRELMRVAELPKGPDEDVSFSGFRGRRISYEGTSGEGHALGRPVYKVEIHPPGTTFSPNGLPVFELAYRNDDGGPTWGKDSRLDFTAPAAGTYTVRIRDSRGESGPHYAYRLTLASPRPDFDLFVTPSNPNVPRGGRVPVTVSAYRRDGFDGPIEVSAGSLPAGVRAERGVILPGHTTVALTLEAAPDASSPAVPLKVVGRAAIGGRSVERAAAADERVSVVAIAAPPDVRVVSVEPAVIELAPGGRARVRARIARENGFAGRVPLAVLNLPFRVTVPDIGLNGILITEAQDSREFEILADEHAPPAEQTLYVTARVETNQVASPEQASVPLRIRIAERAARR